ncbi:MAG: DUF2520 domain-containing protein [Dehalococcoidia bacterium]|nr:DUF2520 domain-containing protein [Dehalococcoidia bacterium]
MLTIGFVGAGTVGTALALSLPSEKYKVLAVYSRTPSSAQRLAQLVPDCQYCQTAQKVADAAELVFITTPDDVISKIASEIDWHKGQGVLHCSGAYSIDILEPARQCYANVGSIHPLQTFASINEAVKNLPGSTFALEADEPLLSRLKELASALNGRYVELKPGNKVLYHTAAVFVSNYLVTLIKLALDLWQDFGVSANEATKSLLPLLKGTVNNIENIGLPNCLTGPIARGDLGTIDKHLNALKAINSPSFTTYQELGLQTISIALAKGKIDDDRAEELKTLLKGQDTK